MKKTDAMQGASCGSCWHWKEETQDGDEIRWGHCRRFPPTAALSRSVITDEEADVAIWPTTVPDDRCGEWKPSN